jgi:hypothetical protein
LIPFSGQEEIAAMRVGDKTMRRLGLSVTTIMLLVVAERPAAAQSVFEGRIVGVTQKPIGAGVVTVTDRDSFHEEAVLRPDGRFSIPGMVRTRLYTITFSDTWGVDHVLESCQLGIDSRAPLTFEARGGLLRRVSIVQSTPEVSGNRLGLSVGTIFLLGSGFNGDFDVRPGLFGNAAFYQKVDGFPILGAPAARNYWEYAVGAAVNNYKGLPQLLDPTQPPGDAQFLRFGVSSGPAFSSASGRSEYAFGFSAAFGGIFDRGQVLETASDGKFTVNSFGLYFRGGIGVPLGALDLILHSRLDLMTTSTGHEADFWSGNVVGLSFGLSIR